MRTKIVAGNWKMNMNASQTDQLLADLKQQNWPSDVQIIVAPTFVNLDRAASAVANSAINVSAQNMHQATHGAFTGEVSADMIASVGVNTVILGHSERRAYFHEDDTLLSQKVNAAIVAGLKVIFCFGEELSDRKAGNHFEVVKSQLEGGIFMLPKEAWSQVVLAYEPVWAIGTGETASPEQAQEMHAFIRETLSQKYDESLAESISVLYGGSVKPANAKEIFAGKDVDGGLIGGAALDAVGFAAIANSF
ncbi:MAG: triose-phosphate isomerase [Gilvibacter sp.]